MKLYLIELLQLVLIIKSGLELKATKLNIRLIILSILISNKLKSLNKLLFVTY